jgi:hypothetical protein
MMKILKERGPVADEMPRRARARIADSAIAAHLDRIADCPASTGVLGNSGMGFSPAGSCGDRYWESGPPPYY